MAHNYMNLSLGDFIRLVALKMGREPIVLQNPFTGDVFFIERP